MARRRKKDSGAVVWLVLIVLVIGSIGSAAEKIWAMLPSIEVYLIFAGGVAVCIIVVMTIEAGSARRVRRNQLLSIEEKVQSEVLEEASRQRQLFEAEADRRMLLLAKFSDESIVEAIMNGKIRHDMTKDQLIEAWGQPASTDIKVMKTKIRETYKYDQIGKNRYARKAILENDVVVGWEI